MTRWRSLRRVPSLLRASAPGWTMAVLVTMALDIAFGLATLYLVKQLVDRVTTGLGTGGDAAAVLRVVLLAGAATLGHAVVRAVAGYAREAQALSVGDHVDRLIHERATEVDLAFYESPRYFDTLQRARQAGLQRPAQVAANLLLLGKNAVLLAATLALIATVHPLIVPVLGLAMLPALAVRLYFTRSQYDWQQRRTQLERRAGYLDWLMTADHHAKELRVHQLGPGLRSAYAAVRDRLRRERLRISRRRTVVETAVATVATVAFFGALAWLAGEAASGRSSVGDLVLFLVAVQRAQAAGRELVAQVARLYEDELYLGLLYRFLDVTPVIAAPATPAPLPATVRDGLRVERVSFRYPDSAGWALHEVSLEIRPGEVVAVVGANGSGKTSLIKLLCRLYDPTEGRIMLDGVDVRAFSPDAYRRRCSVVFQDFARYAETARENIRVGDVALPPDSPRIEAAAAAAGADPFVRALPQGYETRLTRLFDDGQELSVGQWQKLALARAFVGPSDLVILDEPTSALDPDAEFELFEGFRERIGGRMALVISHRLSTVRQADRIYVLDAGRVVEAGTHEALMARRGRYHGMFSRQGRHFQRTAEVVTS